MWYVRTTYGTSVLRDHLSEAQVQQERYDKNKQGKQKPVPVYYNNENLNTSKILRRQPYPTITVVETADASSNEANSNRGALRGVFFYLQQQQP